MELRTVNASIEQVHIFSSFSVVIFVTDDCTWSNAVITCNPSYKM